MSVRFGPVARIFAILYFIIGLGYFFVVSLHHAEYITFPLGILAPLAYLNINLTFPRSMDVLGGAFQLACCLASYSITGWITGVAFVFVFNAIAAKIGGVSARFIAVEDPQPASPSIPSIDNRQ